MVNHSSPEGASPSCLQELRRTLRSMRQRPCARTGLSNNRSRYPRQLDALAINAVFEIGYSDLPTASCDDLRVDHGQKHDPRPVRPAEALQASTQ